MTDEELADKIFNSIETRAKEMAGLHLAMGDISLNKDEKTLVNAGIAAGIASVFIELQNRGVILVGPQA